MAEPRAKRGVGGTNRKNPDGLLDPKSGLQIALAAHEHFVNEGLGYHFGGVATLASGISTYLEMRIPAEKEIHLASIDVWTSVPILDLVIRENPTIVTPGTNVVTPINCNRSAMYEDDESVTDVFDDPATISAGTIILSRRTGAAVKDRTEVLGPTTKLILGDKEGQSIYTFQFANVDSDEGDVSWGFVWHEIESEE